ncbi:MAG: reverse transcriptase domain-containing protein [Bacteroidetes bacterium]|nr:reverse transcriptase domain-containing protein [Bacteroidota bacterium]
MFKQIYSFENLYDAYKKASRNKRYELEALRFRQNLEENLIVIQNELIWKKWTPRAFTSFFVCDPKKRLVMAPAFRDRVAHHALCNIIEPLFERRFIFDSYACRVGKGTHAAVRRASQMAIRDGYVLKADISKYFPSVSNEVLMGVIRQTVNNSDTLWLIERILAITEGLPIGALTSQLFANVYLDQLDHYLKDELGVKRYVRYMDDFVIFHEDKNYLRELLEIIRDFLLTKLKLSFNHKTQILPSRHGLDFCGYRLFETHIKMRKRNVRRAKNRFKQLSADYANGAISLAQVRSCAMSFLGYAGHTNEKRSVESTLNRLNLATGE